LSNYNSIHRQSLGIPDAVEPAEDSVEIGVLLSATTLFLKKVCEFVHILNT
jgi:hypothetical protein